MVVNASYENVSRHLLERRELAPDEKIENVVKGKPGEPNPLSFAAITDEPPAEVGPRGTTARPHYEHRLVA